jgi:predicted acyl esterase
VRGKHGSEGDYVMNRPLHGPLNPTPVDHATDTYDTIDWLVKNVPESNGKVWESSAFPMTAFCP